MADEQKSDTWLSLQHNAEQTDVQHGLKPESKDQNQQKYPQRSEDIPVWQPAEKNLSSPGGYFLTDEYGQIEYCDQAAAALFHTTASRLVNRMLVSMIPADGHQDFFGRLSLIRTTRQTIQWLTKLILADKTNLTVQLTVAYADSAKNRPPSLRWQVQEIPRGDEANQASAPTDSPEQNLLNNQLKDLLSLNQGLLKEIELLKQERLDLIQARDTFDNHLHEQTVLLDKLHVELLAEKTSREQAERASELLARKLSELRSASQILLSTLELEPLISRILDAASQAIPACDKGILYLIAKNTGQLEMRAVFGYHDPRIQTIAPLKSKSYVAKVVQERKPLLINDLEDPQQTEGSTEEARPVRSALIVPLILDGDLFGSLCLESSQSGAFSDGDLELLTSFGATATAAIRNALLHQEVQKLALTDSLTSLYNRRGFHELAKRELERARRFGRPLSALMIDMDHFKEINDIFGHAEGDQVLRQVSHLLKTNIREVDILGRYGGDEFNVLLPETDLFIACNVAERLRQCIEGLDIQFNNQAIPVSASVGVAKYSPDITDLDSLINRADAAMYSAKQSGRNRVEIG